MCLNGVFAQSPRGFETVFDNGDYHKLFSALSLCFGFGFGFGF
jgi:hypothetical protein